MKKNIVIVLLLIISLGFIVYDKYIKKEKDELKECNKEEICDECIYDNDYENIQIDEEGIYRVERSGVYTKDGKVYKLDIYKEFSDNVKIEDVKLNNKDIKVEIIDQILYVNNKKVKNADEIYVTNNHIFIGAVGQLGLVFTASIDSNGNVTNLEDNKILGNFQATSVYLTINGNLVAIGGECCSIEADDNNRVVEFAFSNDKLEITKLNLK